MGSSAITSRKHAEELLVKQATADPSFRTRLLANPREAIAQSLAMPLPAHITFTVVEETDQHIYLVLPAREAGELADEELMNVSGGVMPASMAPTGRLASGPQKQPAGPILPQGGMPGMPGQ